MTILEKIRSGTNFACNFRNPIGIFLKRMIPSSQMLRLIDRATGVRCGCPADGAPLEALARRLRALLRADQR